MIELVRHIEILLLENDCVVIPGFGGFITHYSPASWNEEDCFFTPPSRTIGFNPQLKMNDGVLAQSYMEVYGTDFSDATKMLEQEVNKLIEKLHNEGSVDLINIGVLSLSVHGTYVFSSYDDKVLSPRFYGLDPFEIRDIKALIQSFSEKNAVQPPQITRKKTYEIRINRAFVRNAVAAVAAIVLFFYMSAPLENTYVERQNYAQLLPSDLFGKIEQQSLLTTPVLTAANHTVPLKHEKSVETVAEADVEQDKLKAVPVSVKEIKVPKNQETSMTQEAVPPVGKLHHIVIASIAFEEDAMNMVTDLRKKGYPNASILKSDERIRVTINSYTTREEADKQLNELRKNDAYKSAWLLIR